MHELDALEILSFALTVAIGHWAVIWMYPCVRRKRTVRVSYSRFLGIYVPIGRFPVRHGCLLDFKLLSFG